MTFNPTHEFRGLELEHHHRDGYVFGLGHYYDDAGKLYLLDAHVVTKILPKPQPGEVWAFKTTPTLKDKTPLRFVDNRGNLTNTRGAVQWVPDLDDVEELYQNYTKVLNADGSPA